MSRDMSRDMSRTAAGRVLDGSQQGAQGNDDARLLDIAVTRLEAARAMRTLAAREEAVLAAVDQAARGEIPQSQAEDALASHLEAREACLDAMRAYDDEWATLAESFAAAASASGTGAASGSGPARSAIESVAQQLVAMLDDLARGDAAFATELAARRQAARAELARTDGARAAGRAYLSQALGQAGSAACGPRFTDRTG